MKQLVYTLLLLTAAFLFSCQPKEQAVKFLLFTDLHHDLIPDGKERLQTIIEAAEQHNVEFMVELGDLAFAIPQNEPFRQMFDNTTIPTYHVIGNHDVDKTSKQEYVEFFQLPAAHYYFDKGPFRFVVLDSNFFIDEAGNETPYDHGNYYVKGERRDRFSEEQHRWLEDLLKNKKPIYVILSHAPINDRIAVPGKNRSMHQVIKDAMVSGTRIAAVIAGHNHSDNYQVIDRINYWQVNSASYFWAGNDFYNKERYPEEMYEKYPNLPYMVPYDTTLYAIVEIDSKGTITVKGVQGNYVKPDPDPALLKKKIDYPVSASMKDRELTF